MKLECSKCKSEFQSQPEQSEFIAQSRKKGMTAIMIECPLCKKHFLLNPFTKDAAKTHPEKNASFRCPKIGCTGIVSFISDKPEFWGCGECGSVWPTETSLFSDINKIIKSFPHRAKAYIKNGDGYTSTTESLPPLDYDSNVFSELHRE
ncbi:protein of unknown function [Pseudomonas inefficax]|uniref:Uncharacterized protein n=1 Tax=Pseudomonas inefficax TaxID=2078786 RepID=A0AAQ1SVN0_9PSED|nr:protein of unknown function [Pseudomonas inefficax]